MASKKSRFFMGFMAILFLVTASATTIAVIWDSVHNKNSNNQSNQPKETKVNPDALQGKPLAGFTPVAKIDQLQTIDSTPGNGQEVKASDSVTVDYTGAVAATGIVFQSSKDLGQQASFPLSGVIEGWKQGMPGMKVGGTRRILIPAALAYGPTPPQGSGIPANADLVFDVTLHKIGQ
jgi:FKBP-type peptidyl-prolyl cis-trans isomerase